MMVWFGKSRINLHRIFPDSLKPIHLIPLLFYGYLLVTLVALFVMPPLGSGLLLLLGRLRPYRIHCGDVALSLTVGRLVKRGYRLHSVRWLWLRTDQVSVATEGGIHSPSLVAETFRGGPVVESVFLTNYRTNENFLSISRYAVYVGWPAELRRTYHRLKRQKTVRWLSDSTDDTKTIVEKWRDQHRRYDLLHLYEQRDASRTGSGCSGEKRRLNR